MGRKIIIDTDPGIDDAMAIFYALQSPELDVLALTTVFGNAPTDICTTNALNLVNIAGREDLPVYAGAQRPLNMPFRGGAAFVHGKDGQGDIFLSPPEKKPGEISAAEFIMHETKKYPGEVTLVTLGPLTNVALAYLLDQDLPGRLQEIVMMGGNAFCPGNASPAAEANIINDPEAADLVFGMDCPITMCGLDVTEKILMKSVLLDAIGSIQTARAQHLARILPFYRKFFLENNGLEGIYVHDSTTITYLLAPAAFRCVQHPIRVDTTNGPGRGKTWPALGRSGHEKEWQGHRKVNICVEVDAEWAIQMEMNRLAS